MAPNNETILTVLPGDDVTPHIPPVNDDDNKKNKIKLGIGLRHCPATRRIVATHAGKLQKNHGTYFIQFNSKRYLPNSQDRIVGVVVDRVGTDGTKGGDVYKVNINGPHPAVLSNLEFEGATKRNKPQLQPGTVLYARMLQCESFADPILSCRLGPNDTHLPRKDWMTQEGTYGELRGGTCVVISLGLARQLLHPSNVVLEELSSLSLKFEVCIGVNGVLWVHSERPIYTILIVNAIHNSEVLTEAQTRKMCKSLMETVQRQVAQEEEENDEESDGMQE